MLHEAPTVVKAITKAWEESGQPSEFTIKILEPGKKGFLWFSKHSAIVSISYDPRKQARKTAQPRRKETSRPQRTYSSDRKKPTHQQSYDKGKRPTRDRDRDQKSRYGQQQKSKEFTKDFVSERWTDDWVDNINGNLKEIMSIIKIPTKFTSRIDKKTLHINFINNLLPSAEEERLLFISLSYLLIQFLKKKYKKKLRGFHLVIKSKRSSDRNK